MPDRTWGEGTWNDGGEWFEGVTKDPAKLQKVAQLRAERTPTPPTPRMTGLALSTGDKAGEVDSTWNSGYKQGVKSYEVHTLLNGDPATGTWVPQSVVTKSKAALTGFTSGAKLWVRVRGIGPNGTGPWCDPATSIVP